MIKPQDDVVEALRQAMVAADGDDCDTERALFYLTHMERKGLTLALATKEQDDG